MNDEEFINNNCTKCKNKTKDVCCIVVQIDGKCDCKFFEEETTDESI